MAICRAASRWPPNRPESDRKYDGDGAGPGSGEDVALGRGDLVAGDRWLGESKRTDSAIDLPLVTGKEERACPGEVIWFEAGIIVGDSKA